MTAAPTVQQELTNRRDCRYGLRGVRVRYRGTEYVVGSSAWRADRDLRLILMEPGQVDVTWLKDNPRARADAPRGFICGADLLIGIPGSPGEVEDVPAVDCTLAGLWPVVCCRPSRWTPFNSCRQARREGIASLARIATRYEFVAAATADGPDVELVEHAPADPGRNGEHTRGGRPLSLHRQGTRTTP